MQKFLSVIVPVYNVGKYLKQCADSSLSQQISELELILVDDGSTDNCGELCDALAAREDRVCVIHKSNGGLADARNAGLDAASGEYVAFLDGDDFYAEDALARATDVLARERPDLLLFNYARFYDDKNRMGREQIRFPQSAKCAPNSGGVSAQADCCDCESNSDALFEELVRAGAFLSSACFRIAKRSLIESGDPLRFEKGALSEDIEFSASLLARAQSVAVADETVYAYRVRKGSITKTLSEKHVDDLIKIITRIAQAGDVAADRKAAYLGYAAFQFCTLLINTKLAEVQIERGMSQAKRNSSSTQFAAVRREAKLRKCSLRERTKQLSPLLQYALDPKSKLIGACYSLMGHNVTSVLLMLYFKMFRD